MQKHILRPLRQTQKGRFSVENHRRERYNRKKVTLQQSFTLTIGKVLSIMLKFDIIFRGSYFWPDMIFLGLEGEAQTLGSWRVVVMKI